MIDTGSIYPPCHPYYSTPEASDERDVDRRRDKQQVSNKMTPPPVVVPPPVRPMASVRPKSSYTSIYQAANSVSPPLPGSSQSVLSSIPEADVCTEGQVCTPRPLPYALYSHEFGKPRNPRLVAKRS